MHFNDARNSIYRVGEVVALFLYCPQQTLNLCHVASVQQASCREPICIDIDLLDDSFQSIFDRQNLCGVCKRQLRYQLCVSLQARDHFCHRRSQPFQVVLALQREPALGIDLQEPVQGSLSADHDHPQYIGTRTFSMSAATVVLDSGSPKRNEHGGRGCEAADPNSYGLCPELPCPGKQVICSVAWLVANQRVKYESHQNDQDISDAKSAADKSPVARGPSIPSHHDFPALSNTTNAVMRPMSAVINSMLSVTSRIPVALELRSTLTLRHRVPLPEPFVGNQRPRGSSDLPRFARCSTRRHLLLPNQTPPPRATLHAPRAQLQKLQRRLARAVLRVAHRLVAHVATRGARPGLMPAAHGISEAGRHNLQGRGTVRSSPAWPIEPCGLRAARVA